MRQNPDTVKLPPLIRPGSLKYPDTFHTFELLYHLKTCLISDQFLLMKVDFRNTPLRNRRLRRYGCLITAARFPCKVYLIAAADLPAAGKDSFRKKLRIGTDNILCRPLHRNLKKQFSVFTGNPGNLK